MQATVEPVPICEPPSPFDAMEPLADADGGDVSGRRHPPTAALATRVGLPCILIADPDPAVFLAMSGACMAIPAAVLRAGSPDAAVGICRLWRPDLVLIDVDVPDGSGLHAVAAIRTLPGCATLPIVAITTSRAPALPVSVAAACDATLRRPIQPLSFMQAAIGLLERPGGLAAASGTRAERRARIGAVAHGSRR